MAADESQLTFLLDTNLFIAGEPRSDDEVEDRADDVAALIGRIQQEGHRLQLHPSAVDDIRRDADRERQRARLVQITKYPLLPSPPQVPEDWRQRFTWEDGDNDHVDLLHLAAVQANAVSVLVTQDKGLLRNAAKVGLGDRVITIDEASQLLETLHPAVRLPPPTVEHVRAHELDNSDPIFGSLRADYAPDFDEWLIKAQRQQRDAFIVKGDDREGLAAVAIVKEEHGANDAHLPGRVMKISTFKVAEEGQGRRRGELLLKTLFLHAQHLRVDGTYLTVFADGHPELVALIEQFGFHNTGLQTSLGEQIYAKRLDTDVGRAAQRPSDALAYHVELGPPALMPDAGDIFMVPIQPSYSRRLFPDAAPQLELVPPAPYGNALRKAYLSLSSSRLLKPGDVLCFYESGSSSQGRGIVSVGVVERTIASTDPDEVAGEVGTRTVYSMGEIREMAQDGEVLAIIFRQDRILDDPIPLPELVDNRALKSAPQSITKTKPEGEPWLRARLHESL